jgi:flagellar biosynthesis anti-sigma factor FlgM
MAGVDSIGTLGQLQGASSLNGNGNGVAQAAQTAAATEAQTTHFSPASTSGAPTDQANVSSTGGLVAQALNTPDVRLDKVAALQSAISSGTYQVPASAVAGKIVDSLLS